jgi:isochorismate synthase
MTLEDFFDSIEQQYNKQLPFVVYRKPNRMEVKAILQKTDTLHITEDFNESGFVFSPFDDKDATVLMPIPKSEVISSSYAVLSTIEIPRNHNNEPIIEEARNHHIDLVGKGINAIANNEFEKVVLSRQESINISVSNPISILKKLLNAYKAAFVYCWYHPKVGLWLGATPETLLKIEDNRFSMMALAATQDYNGTLEVLWQEKEKQEQQFVTDFIIEHLKPSAESFKVSDVEAVKAGNLMHLKTMISAKLKPGVSLKQIISAMHPTPAVCGLPKESSKEFILKHENYNREFYTGFLGELNFETMAAPRSGRRNIENRAYAHIKETTQLYVNLRCMQIKDGAAILYVGGGITKDSNQENEWQETVSKSMVIKNVLQ